MTGRPTRAHGDAMRANVAALWPHHGPKVIAYRLGISPGHARALARQMGCPVKRPPVATSWQAKQ